MNLNELREFLFANRKRVLLIFGIVVFILVVIITALPKDQVTTPSNGNGEEALPPFTFNADMWSITEGVDFSKLKTASFPESATIYNVEQSFVTTSEVEAEEIAMLFGFEGEALNQLSLPEGGTMYVFVKDNENIAVITQPREIRYSVKDFIYTAGNLKGSLYDETIAIQIANSFMEGKKLSTGFSFYDSRLLIYKGELTAETTDSKKANILEMSFVHTVQGQEILGKLLIEPPVRILFNRKGEVVSFSYKFPDQSFTRYREVKLISFDNVMSNLRNKGLVISITPVENLVEEGIEEQGNLTSFTPESVKLVLYQSGGTSLLYPIYLFEGSGKTSEGNVNAVVIFSAIETE